MKARLICYDREVNLVSVGSPLTSRLPAGSLYSTPQYTPLAVKLQMNKHSLSISKIINGGFGLGQLTDGRLAMIRQALPGEEVVISTEEEKKNYLVGNVVSITTPSPFRVDPPCPYYAACGGCDLQHASYEEQLKIKRDILMDLLTRQKNLTDKDLTCPIAPPLPAPQQSGYRQRIRLWIKDGAVPGFRQRRSHNIVAVRRCLIAREELNQSLAALLDHPPATKLFTNTSELELLYNPVSTKVTALFHLSRKPRPADTAVAKNLVETIDTIERIFFTGQQFPITAAAPVGCDNLFGLSCEPVGTISQPFTMQWEVGGFCQVNLEQNIQLVKLASEYAAISAEETVLDLFCGSGNFSIPLAATARSLMGIEGQGSAIRSAKTNSSNAGLTNTTFYKKPIHTACEELTGKSASFDCLVIDPPRQGIPGLARQLSKLCRSRMVYISCDPATLSRDLGDLVAHGFRITRIQPVDMFPETHHIETVVLLEKH
ncbi:23S rRNA (uracil1939-C5)-methyltransferase [Desulfopila aestuarii DSM 18488]|uniref:23S rRNA (Uracil1939-C5)-methyltransferase n=2 Tax=Desulfopila aestuarii TaxID=231440 RepID=A0A1M7Y850_9BACT|nr:23S rRNA (uracil1939-C5)-methyltransferase [Desulfopila aestuarii DSM 18488]